MFDWQTGRLTVERCGAGGMEVQGCSPHAPPCSHHQVSAITTCLRSSSPRALPLTVTM